MFSKLGSTPVRKRFWTPNTLAVSVGAHLLVLGGAIYLSTRESPAAAGPPEVLIPPYIIEIPPEEPEFQPAPPEVPRVAASVPTPTPQANPPLVPPAEIPPRIMPEPEGVLPVDPGAPIVAGDPRAGGDPNAPLAGDDRGVAHPGTVGPTEPYTLATVTSLPKLRNAQEVQRLTERLYPSLLRESGVTGTVVLRFVIDTDGTVNPATVEIVSATHEGFENAAIEAAKKLRFIPAQVNGTPVRVLTSVPIQWRLQDK